MWQNVGISREFLAPKLPVSISVRRSALPPDAPTAFFSYSREDSGFALRLAADLKAAGANVWLDQLDIQPGQRWARAVQDALNNAQRVLVILSPTSVDSTNVEDEVNFALEEHKTVIPIFFRDCKVPFQLRPFQYIDFRTDYDRGLKLMLGTLGVERQSAAGAAAVSGIPQEAHSVPRQEHIWAPNRALVEQEARERLAAAERPPLEEEERAAAQVRPAEGQRARQESEHSDASTAPLPMFSFSMAAGWKKVLLSLCGVLVVAFLLYLAMRPGGQKAETQKQVPEFQQPSRAPATENSSRNAAAEPPTTNPKPNAHKGESLSSVPDMTPRAKAPNSGAPIGGLAGSDSGHDEKSATPQRVRVSQGVSQGLLIHKVQPIYPPLARQARVQGTVVLQALIGTDGTIENLHVVSGHPMLTDAALQAVKQWQYKTYYLNGNPVEVETTINVNFTLAGE